MVGLLTYAIGVFFLGIGEVNSSIFPSVGPTSSFFLGDSSIVMGDLCGCLWPPMLDLGAFSGLKI